LLGTLVVFARGYFEGEMRWNAVPILLVLKNAAELAVHALWTALLTISGLKNLLDCRILHIQSLQSSGGGGVIALDLRRIVPGAWTDPDTNCRLARQRSQRFRFAKRPKTFTHLRRRNVDFSNWLTFILSIFGFSRSSTNLMSYFCRVVSRKVAEDSRFDCGQEGSFAVFAAYLRCPVVLCGRLEPAWIAYVGNSYQYQDCWSLNVCPVSRFSAYIALSSVCIA